VSSEPASSVCEEVESVVYSRVISTLAELRCAAAEAVPGRSLALRAGALAAAVTNVVTDVAGESAILQALRGR
jgi:hypothetical protein